MILRGVPGILGFGTTAILWICLLLIVTSSLAQDGRTYQSQQQQYRQNSQVRRGQGQEEHQQNIIRTRVSSGIPLRRITTPFYEPIYEASEAVESGYGYVNPEKINRRPAAVEVATTENNNQVDRAEEPAPVRPQKSFQQNSRQPIEGESEQSIDSEGIFPSMKNSPSPMRLVMQNSQSKSSSQPHGHDDGAGGVWPDGYKGVIPGVEGVDYPIYSSIPETSFSCGSYKYSGYYADEEARCQVFHVCLRRLRRRSIEKWSFLCPNGTVFSQKDFVCVWWNNAPSCDSSTLGQLYELNANLGWDNHADSATQSIRNMMATMVPAPGGMMSNSNIGVTKFAPTPIPTPPQKTFSPPIRSQSQNEESRGQRIPVSLSASLGGGQKRVNIQTTVPVTKITEDAIQSSQPDREYETNIDSQLVDTRTTSQQESRTKTKSGSALHRSQSEAYEQFGESDALEKPGPFIVNREPKVMAKVTEEPMPSSEIEDRPSQRGGDEADRAPVPTLVMIPVQQDYPDGSTRVIDMPVMIMMKDTQKPIGFPPAAVTNPKGVTIPNLPQSPPRTYLPPRRETTTMAEALTSGTFPTTTNLPPREEQEFNNNVDYSENDREPPGTQPIIDYELSNSETPQPVTPPMTQTTTLRPSNTYLPPRAQTISPPPTTTTLPDLPQTEQVTEEEHIPTTMAPLKQSQIESAAVPGQPPSGAYLPPKLMSSMRSQSQQDDSKGTFVAMDGELVNQILQSAGIMDLIDDGKEIRGFQPSTEGNDEKVQYPTPESSQVNQGNRQDVGTPSQLFNGQVRTVFSNKKQAQISPQGGVTPLPTYNMDKNKELLEKIQYGGYNEGSGNKLADGLEKITPGYIDLPVRANPTQISPAELPGTESVRAFLTSQKDVDPKQTLEIFQFDKYALFVPDAAQREKNGLSLTYGTPAPNGLVQGPTVLPQSVESLFGPLARDVIPQQQKQFSAQPQNGGYSNSNNDQKSAQKPSGGYSNNQQQQQSSSSSSGGNGYNYNKPSAQSSSTPIQAPSGLYGPPSKDFRPSPPDDRREKSIVTDVTVQTTVERTKEQKAPASQTQISGQEQQRPQEQLNAGYNYNENNLIREPLSQGQPAQSILPQTYRLPQIQLQLPVLVESHSSHLIPFPSPQPQFFLPQQQQQQQQQRDSSAYGVPNPPPRPSGLYTPPFLNAPLNYIQPQSSVLSNAVHVPSSNQVSLPLSQFRNSHEAEVIQAIPVHASTIVETRPVQRGPPQPPPQQQPQGGYNNAQLPPYQPFQVQPQFPQLNDLNAYHHHQQQINRVQFQHQQPRALTHSVIPFTPQLIPQQIAQFQAPIVPIPQQQQLHHPPPPQIQTDFRPIVQPIQQQQQHPRGGYNGGTHYDRNSQQPQQGTGYRNVNQQQQVGGQRLNMFTPHEGTSHQQSHQQNVQQFIQQQRERSNNQHNNLAHGSNTLASNAHRTIALPQQHQQQQQQKSGGQIVSNAIRRPSGSYGTGTGSQLEMAGEQVSYNNYEVFYPGQDKSLGVKLTYQFTD